MHITITILCFNSDIINSSMAKSLFPKYTFLNIPESHDYASNISLLVHVCFLYMGYCYCFILKWERQTWKNNKRLLFCNTDKVSCFYKCMLFVWLWRTKRVNIAWFHSCPQTPLCWSDIDQSQRVSHGYVTRPSEGRCLSRPSGKNPSSHLEFFNGNRPGLLNALLINLLFIVQFEYWRL